MTEDEIIRQFHGLYAGGRAQRMRDEGQPDAMPPWAETYWFGKQVVKCPTDLWTYQEIIVETKPDLIIETGTSGGGSAFFFATIMDQIGHGHVITVDKDSYPELCRPHERITYLVGDSNSVGISGMLALQFTRRMVSLDSLHTYDHVKRELELYAPLVSVGCYLVVEDTNMGKPGEPWADQAVEEFLASHPNFWADRTREKHLLTCNRGGWLKRIA